MAQKADTPLRHSIIEVIAVLILVVFGDKAANLDKNITLVQWVEFAGVAIVILIALHFIDKFLDSRPMRVGSVGKIDGVWLDAIYDGKGDLIEGSFIEMRCTQAEGFHVEGWSYEIQFPQNGELTVITPSPGDEHHFKGDGSASELLPDCCSYCYEGREGRVHKGGGFYKFRRGADKQLLFDGGFGYWNLIEGSVTAARLVQGEKYKGKKKNYETPEKRVALLKEFLRKRSRRYSCSP
jgi:hypothetical protein